jgi:hypothetical protein
MPPDVVELKQSLPVAVAVVARASIAPTLLQPGKVTVAELVGRIAQTYSIEMPR